MKHKQPAFDNELIFMYRRVQIALLALLNSPSRQPIDQLERAKAMGFRGVGELHPGMQKYQNTNQNGRHLPLLA